MISVFTPTHNLNYIYDTYEGLRTQTCPEWEWVVVPNGPARGYMRDFGDRRVKVVNAPQEMTGLIGPLKRFACEHSTGVAVLELDHDDILLPTAIEEAAKAFADPTVDFAYSNFVSHDFRCDHPAVFNGVWGWVHRPFVGRWQGRWMMETVSSKPYPQSISRVWYAPNHFRAWRRDFYNRIGGHAVNMRVSDDQDLICRTYIHGKMLHIDKPLYIYRIHGENSWLAHQAEIQKLQWQCHDSYIEAMMLKWCQENGGLRRIALGEPSPTDGYEPVPLVALNGSGWPFPDDSVGCIRSTDTLQFLADPVAIMNEAYRVLAHGGIFFITVPASEGAGGWDNPAIRSHWNWRSFRYYTERAMALKVPGIHCRWQKIKVDQVTNPEGIPYVVAHLIAVKKEEPRFFGELLI